MFVLSEKSLQSVNEYNDSSSGNLPVFLQFTISIDVARREVRVARQVGINATTTPKIPSLSSEQWLIQGRFVTIR